MADFVDNIMNDMPTGGEWCLQKYKEIRDKLKTNHTTTHLFRLWRAAYFLVAIFSSWLAAFELGFTDDNNREVFLLLDCLVFVMAATNMMLSLFFGMEGTTTSFFLTNTYEKLSFYLADGTSILFPTLFYSDMLKDKIYLYLQISRCSHLWRIIKLISIWKRDVSINYTAAQTAHLLTIVYYIHHYGACIFYRIGKSKDRKKSWISLLSVDINGTWSFYTASIYWAITTLTSVGYGDVHATNPMEMLAAALYIMVSTTINGYVLVSVVNLVTGKHNRITLYRKKLRDALRFAEMNHLTPHLQQQINSYIAMKYDTGLDTSEYVLDEIPRVLKAQVFEHLFHNSLKNAYLFRGISDELIFQIISESQIKYFRANEDIIVKNQTCKGFYIIVAGEVELIAGDANAVVQVMKEQGVFGEIGVLLQRMQFFTARSKTVCKLLYFDMKALIDIIEANDILGTTIMRNLNEHLASSHEPIVLQSPERGETSNLDVNRFRRSKRNQLVRITACGFSKGRLIRKNMILPNTLEELFQESYSMFDYVPARIENEKGGVIDDIATIQDGDVINFTESSLVYKGEVPDDYVDDGEFEEPVVPKWSVSYD